LYIYSKYRHINVPGYEGSGPEHWQTFWEHKFPNIERVQQQDWGNPNCYTWVKTLEEFILKDTSKPIILIGHSLGVCTILHAASQNKLQGVVGAFLVAMPDAEREDFPEAITGFNPLPKAKLPFPSCIIASENDPYISIEKLEYWAKNIGSAFVNVGERGHIGTAAKLGFWDEGQLLFKEFISKIN
jgi:uncharacterized protein